MTYLVAIVSSAVLFAGFLALTRFEYVRGTRYFPAGRKRLDAITGRMLFIARHVDFSSFIRSETARIARVVGHAVVATSLYGIRAVEHMLTRLVRRLRAEGVAHRTPPDHPSGRPFISALTDFKLRLSSHRSHKKREDSELPANDIH